MIRSGSESVSGIGVLLEFVLGALGV